MSTRMRNGMGFRSFKAVAMAAILPLTLLLLSLPPQARSQPGNIEGMAMTQAQPSTTWYLAEGCAAGDFETWVLVQNPGEETAHLELSFQTENGPVEGPQLDLAPGSRHSFLANQYVQTYDLSTKLTSDKPVVAERAVYWNNREGGHDSIGVTSPELI